MQIKIVSAILFNFVHIIEIHHEDMQKVNIIDPNRLIDELV